MRGKENIFQTLFKKAQSRLVVRTHLSKEMHPNYCITNDAFAPYIQNVSAPFQEYTLYAYSESEPSLFAIAEDCITHLFGACFSVFHVIACERIGTRYEKSIFKQYRNGLFSNGEAIFSNDEETELIVICKSPFVLTKHLALELDGTFHFQAYAYSVNPEIASFTQAIQLFDENNYLLRVGYFKWPDDVIFVINPEKISTGRLLAVVTSACAKQRELLDNEVS